MQKLNLQQFAGSLTVTIMKDDNSHWTAASASPASSLAKNDTVTLTVTPASGYELDEIEVLAGGVTIDYDPDDGYTFKMGESNVTLFFKSKGDNVYQIVENTEVNINGTKTNLVRNMMLKYGVNGAVVGVDASGAAITLSSEIVSELVKSGAIIKV